MVKMKSKKSKSKKKPKSEAKTEDQLSEVDKTFYELQIADLNRKVSRLTNLSADLEQKNEVLTASNRDLDEDRADVIAYLKKTVQDQSAQIIDLLGRLEALKATLQADAAAFQVQLSKKDADFHEMRTHLKSEINLLDGKLNALEEFRLQRDELNKKFEEQGQKIGEQDKAHKDELYAVERKFIVDKDILIKNMQQKLRNLAHEFQNVTDLRITETTQRMIRENIAVNNENVKLIQEQKELHKERDELIAKKKTMKMRMELAEDQCNQALRKGNVLKSLVTDLVTKYEDLEKQSVVLKQNETKIEEKDAAIMAIKSKSEELQANIKVLQGNLKDSRDQRKILLSELTKANKKSEFLTSTLFEVIFKIRQRLNPQKEVDVMKGTESQDILNDLYDMFLNAKAAERECKNLESWVQFYKTGCVGFVPRPRDVEEIKERNQGTQVGVSFEEFLALDEDSINTKHQTSTASEETTIPSDFSSN